MVNKVTRWLVVSVVAITCAASSAAVYADTDPLPYSKGYLLTGGYAVGGVDVSSVTASGGFVTGTIPMSGVPANADIVAAFLYWETISQATLKVTDVKFRGSPVTAVKASSKALDSNTPCWGSGSTYKLSMFRADVLRLLPPQLDANRVPTGKRLVNDADLTAGGFGLNTVKVHQSNGNQLPESAGASLVVIYRDPAQPLRKI